MNWNKFTKFIESTEEADPIPPPKPASLLGVEEYLNTPQSFVEAEETYPESFVEAEETYPESFVDETEIAEPYKLKQPSEKWQPTFMEMSSTDMPSFLEQA